jgi:metallopeptidase MepB
MISKYLSPPQPPLTFTSTAESIREDNDQVCKDTQTALDGIANAVAPAEATCDNVLRPIAHSENQRQLVTGVLDLLLKVSDNIDVRNAAADAEKERSRFMVDLGMRNDIFQLVDSVFQRGEEIDAESLKFLVEARRKFVRNGLLLTLQGDKDRLNEIRKRLGTVTADFVRNLDEEDAHIWFTPDQLVGLPDDVQGRLERGTGDMAGKTKVGLEGPDFMLVMKFARSEDTRREIFTARADKVSAGILSCSKSSVC